MKRVSYHSGFIHPTLHWRLAGHASFNSFPMQQDGAGRSDDEWLWSSTLPVAADATVEFFISQGGDRDPARRWYESRTEFTFLQDGQLFTYRPAARVEAPRRAYDGERPQRIWSEALRQERTFRVYLPRGYRQHLKHRYPVVYIQDGQNIFEHGSFGSWQAQVALDRCIARGQTEEVIVVAVDHGAARWEDYVPREDGGANHEYARFLAFELKPHIDRLYRTRTGAADTALLGSSLGGVAALSIAWDFFHVFGKAASLSGAWWLKEFQRRMVTQGRRPLKIYLDSGNAGPCNDCVHHTLELQHVLHHHHGYRHGQELRHVIADQHTHTEAAWGLRIQDALRFLFPARRSEAALAA